MTMLYENIRLALFSLRANKMRSLLTMLGIIIGIASVIAIMTVGDSVTATVTDSMSSLGANNVQLMLEPVSDEEEEGDNMSSMMGISFSQGDEEKEPRESDLITADMLTQLKETYPEEIKAFSVSESVGKGELQLAGQNANVMVSGTSLGFFMANDIDMLEGNYFAEQDMENGSMVALLSEDALDDLFDGDAKKAVGSEVTMAVDDKYYNLVISGVYKAPDENDASNANMMMFMMGNDTTNLYVPLKTAQRINHTSGYNNLTVVINPEKDPEIVKAQIEEFFDNIYRNNHSFHVTATTYASLVSIMQTIMDTITSAIALIGGIALVVGGIGVMNIMLVSITERTREIGTRKALGAPNSSIRMQFIIESIVICIIGGIIGILIGCAGGIALARYVGADVVPSLRSILISLGFSMAIGVFFGYYPANKAAKLNPIDALRYE
jgi:putative ABC transport system permease protein